MSKETTLDLGPCCVCEGTRDVHNVICLEQCCPVSGRGWGCVVCDLPGDGAMAVLCDDCLEKSRGEPGSAGLLGLLRFACRGYPATDGRIPIGELTGKHEHDLRRHQEEMYGE